MRKIRKVQKVKVWVDGKRKSMSTKAAWNLAAKDPERVKYSLEERRP